MKINKPLLLALSPLCLYLFGINSYFLPDQYDNVLYYFGAQSLITDGTYYFFDQPIARWPPVTSLLLALPFALGLQSVLVAKGIVLLFAGLGLVLSYRLLILTKRPYPALITAIFALLPFSVILGTRIMSEWIFAALSFLFLLLLERQQRQNRSLRFALILGVLLGATALTRWVGFLLGAAVAAQAVDRLLRQRSGLKDIAPEILTGTVGGLMMVTWIALFANLDAIGVPPALQGLVPTNAEAAQTITAPENPNPFEKPGRFLTIRRWDRTSNLFFVSSKIVKALKMHHHHWLAYLAFLPSIVVLGGLVSRLRSDRASPVDWYVLAHLGFLYYLAWWDERYWMPLAPFLLDYFFCGLRPLKRFLGRWTTALTWSALAGWIIMLTSLNLYLVFKGNLSGTHGGLNPLTSPSAESFYRGKWSHLYKICQTLKEQPLPGRVAVLALNGHAKYARAFSGREPVLYEANSFAPYLLADQPELPPSFVGEPIAEQGPFVLYRTATPHKGAGQ